MTMVSAGRQLTHHFGHQRTAKWRGRACSLASLQHGKSEVLGVGSTEQKPRYINTSGNHRGGFERLSGRDGNCVSVPDIQNVRSMYRQERIPTRVVSLSEEENRQRWLRRMSTGHVAFTIDGHCHKARSMQIDARILETKIWLD